MTTPAITVIVIAYNAEKFISRCIESIIHQSFVDYELLIINDGSTDNTKKIIDDYQTKYPQIQSIHQKNQGVAFSRQKGLDLASGQYTIFVDADDWIEPEMIGTLYCIAIQEDADIVFSDFLEEIESGTFYRKQQPKSRDSKEVLKQMLVDLHGGLCNKLIRRDLYVRTGIRFIETLNYREDECLLIRLLSTGCRVSYVDKAFYHYDKKVNNHSISNLSVSIPPIRECDVFLESCEPYFNTPELKRTFSHRVTDILRSFTYAPKEYYKECRRFYQKYKRFVFISALPLTKKLFYVLYFNGFRFLGQLRSVLRSI